MTQHQVYNGSLIKTTLRHRGDKRTTKTSRIHTHKRLYITVLGKSSFSKVHKMQQSYRVRRTVGDYVRQRFPPTAVKGACCSSCLADEDKQRYHQQRQKHREYTHSEIPQGFTTKRLIPLRKPDKIHFCWKSTGVTHRTDRFGCLSGPGHILHPILNSMDLKSLRGTILLVSEFVPRRK